MTSAGYSHEPGTLTPSAARALPVLEALKLVGARLWLASVRIAAAAAVLAGHDLGGARTVEALLTEAEGALSDVVEALRAVHAGILRTEAHDGLVGVVLVEDHAWLWREQVRGIRLDLGTAPKAAAELVTDMGALSIAIRLTARAFGPMARRASTPPRGQLALLPESPPVVQRAEPPPCPGCGVTAFPHGDGCTHEAALAARAKATLEADQVAKVAGWRLAGWDEDKGWRATYQHVTDSATTLEAFGRTPAELQAEIHCRNAQLDGQGVPR